MSRPLRTLCWLVSALLTAAVSGLVASIAPPRLRLLGLFALAIGAACGWLAGRLTVTLRMPSRRIALVGGFLAGGIGFAVVSLLNWQEYSHELLAAEKPNAGQVMMENMLKAAEESDASDPESAEALAEFRDSATRALAEARQRRSFRGFLTHRAATLELSANGAALQWGLEIILAGAAGLLTARRNNDVPFCESCDHFAAVSRSQRFEFPETSQLAALIPEIADPTDASVTIRLLRCHCPDRAAQVAFEITEGAVGTTTSGICELDDSGLSEISRLMDKADGIHRAS